VKDVFQIGRVGTLRDRHEFGDVEKVLGSLSRRLDHLTGPYQIRRPTERFSAGRSKDGTIAHTRELLEQHEGGVRLVIRGSDPAQHVLAVRRTIEMGGPAVLQEAIRNIGVPYDFGSMNPVGAAGGPGAQLDCSGLVCVCYAVVDVDLPHRAEGIHTSDQVELFDDPALVRPGDIVLYHTGSQGLPASQADHCAILVDRDHQIAAPATGQLVQRQPVNMGSLLSFAFVQSVTGSH
jgi:cell wall-associated NlpC family hydrolase